MLIISSREQSFDNRANANALAVSTVVSSTPFLSEKVGVRMTTIASTNDQYRTHVGLSLTLQRLSLVLNRNWQPINASSIACAMIMLTHDSAKIVDPINDQMYNWSDWSLLVQDRDEPFIQSVCRRSLMDCEHCGLS